MTFAEILEIGASVIASLGGGAAIVFGFSNYLGKAWADRALEKQRQEHTKLNLELTHQLGLLAEQAKHSLQITALEHQVRFSNLHEKRAAVIADLYKRLVEAFWDGERFVFQPGQLKHQEEYLATQKRILDFYVFVETHRIYLPEHICALLANFIDALKKPVISVYVYGGIDYPNPQTLKERNEAFMAACEAFKNDIPAARKALEDEFRHILGVETTRPPNSAA